MVNFVEVLLPDEQSAEISFTFCRIVLGDETLLTSFAISSRIGALLAIVLARFALIGIDIQIFRSLVWFALCYTFEVIPVGCVSLHEVYWTKEIAIFAF